MSSCCESPTEKPASSGTLTVALAGNPNSGKTTIFNALTGLRQKVANYPGVTVEKKTGRCKLLNGKLVNIVDLPGTYSLISRSPDEQVANQVLRGLRADVPAPDVVIVVVDASNLQRNLYLVSQLIELGRPMVVALNMMDIAQRRGLHVSAEKLQKELGVPVVPVVGYKKKGIDALKSAITQAVVAPLPDWPLPEAMREEIALVGGGLAILDSAENARLPQPRKLDHYRNTAERLLVGDRADDMGELAEREPVASLLTSAGDRLRELGLDPMQADVEAHYRWIELVAKRVCEDLPGAQQDSTSGTDSASTSLELNSDAPVHFSERLDRILIHKVWGLLIFAAIMAALFVSIFWLAQPVMNGITAAINWFGDLAVSHIGPGELHDLIHDGIFAGVGTVIVFVPQIALLFFFLAILEDSGYLARAAFLMDRLLSKVGLHGKSFIPLLSSFACAIPGIMAARTIENRKDRLATIFVAPFMSCSARLPVYTLLIGTVFVHYGPVKQAGVMLACYALGILAAVGTAYVFRRSLLKGGTTSFILELPSYKMPQLGEVVRQVWKNSAQFVTKAGTTILFISILLWAVSYYPRMPQSRIAEIQKPFDDQITAASEPKADTYFGGVANGKSIAPQDARAAFIEALSQQRDNASAAAQSEYSIAGRVGHAMQPLIRPLGFNWKMGVGLISAFAARETFVSSMGITYAVGDPDENGTASLASAMQKDRYANGQPVWTPLVAVSLLAWFVLAMQCMSTIAIVRRETNGWKWPIFMLIYMNALAYVVSLGIYQIGSHLHA
jgi:ferrous iron transport protein B